MKSQSTFSTEPLKRDFYLREPKIVAREMLGKRLVHWTAAGETSGIIVETEAYLGREDAACHSYLRQSPVGNHRTNIMFSAGGVAYVYLIYGMYNCFNVVVNEQGNPQAVLVRAIQPMHGITLMQRRRTKMNRKKTETRSPAEQDKNIDVRKLCNGPGKLCVAMDITREQNGYDLCSSELFLTEGEEIAMDAIVATPRINVNYAADAALWPLRFVIRDSLFLSTKKLTGKER